VLGGHVETDPVRVAAEQILIRWTTEPGSCFWDLAMGAGLLSLANADLGPGDLARIETRCRTEAAAVIGVVVLSVTATNAAGQVRIAGKFRTNEGVEFAIIADSAGAAEVLQ